MWLYVPLRKSEYERLLELARSERRRPQDQAALLIEQALGQPAESEQGARPTEAGHALAPR